MKLCKILLSIILLAAQGAAGQDHRPDFLSTTNSDPRTVVPVTPTRIVWMSDGGVTNADVLLEEFSGQVTTSTDNVCLLSTRGGREAAILLDFGREHNGSLQIASAIRPESGPVNVRVRLGESVSEAMSEEGSTATNDHAMRDFVIAIPWVGTIEVGESGFRFARIDLLDEEVELPLFAVRTMFKYRDLPYLGSFACDDPRLNDIWMTGAYTVHLNMQQYLWDGIKRDRLVWLGDLHPELVCVASVFGDQEILRRTLDFGRNTTPIPGWMNGMPAYSLWWIISHRDLYLYTGDLDYLRQQQQYMRSLVSYIIANTDGSREDLSDGVRFLDWPTSQMPEVIHSGLQSLTVMSLEAAMEAGRWMGDRGMVADCRKAVERLRQHTPPDLGNKQAAAMLMLAGMIDPAEATRTITDGGADRFSTFFGYYMLEALARAGEYTSAMEIISDYWGGMLDLGATTFWEDLTYTDLAKASRIDEMLPAGHFDIHAESGDHCYTGMRLSMCHGWASGPTSWLSRYVLGIMPTEPGFSAVSIKSNLGNLRWAEGTFPTPHGIIKVRHERLPDNSVHTEMSVPPGVRVIP